VNLARWRERRRAVRTILGLGTVSERSGLVSPILLVVLPLVVVLYVLIVKINRGEHHTPQAYYRRKTGGAPLAHGFESLGPRGRKRPPGDLGDGDRRT
jgi:hypothetical protein